jgi:hypothetical protein
MARWCDSRYGMILYVGALDDGYGSSSGYGKISVSRGVVAAQERVKEGGTLHGQCRAATTGWRRGARGSGAAAAQNSTTESSSSGMDIRLRPTGWD